MTDTPDTDAAIKAGFRVKKLPTRAAYKLGESNPGWRHALDRRVEKSGSGKAVAIHQARLRRRLL